MIILRRDYLTLSLLFILIASIAAQQPVDSQKSEQSWFYFGQKPPGKTPEVFAPGIISTEGYDITPSFSPTMDEVYWGKRETEQGNDNKIYYSKLKDNKWEQSSLASFSSGAMEFEAQFSCDGNRVYFNRGRNLYYSERTETGWSSAVNLPEPVSTGMCIAAAQNGSLYFTAARNKQYGIFRSTLSNGKFEEPKILIPMAAHPFVAPDESYLIFDMYSIEEGKQTSKLFVSFQLENSKWSDPIELGSKINATGTELIAKLSPCGEYLFFQRKVKNNTDIYWVDATFINALKP